MKKFLVAVDGSSVAPAVLETAVKLARRSDATLTLLRVVGLPVELPERTLVNSPEEVGNVLETLAKTDLAQLAELVPRELVTKIRVELGSPWQKVCEVGVEEDVDLIIVGSHGYGVLDRILGTTASRVVNHADRSVLVVRPKKMPI